MRGVSRTWMAVAAAALLLGTLVRVGSALTWGFEESGWAWGTTATGEGMIWIG